MKPLYFDRNVTCPETGVRGYRVQGTGEWVLDRRADGTVVLIPEHSVRKGLFAFEVARGSSAISVYRCPFVDDDNVDTKLPQSSSSSSLEPGEVVVCDITPKGHFCD